MVVVQAKFKTSVSGCKQNLIGQINAIKYKWWIWRENLKALGELVK